MCDVWTLPACVVQALEDLCKKETEYVVDGAERWFQSPTRELSLSISHNQSFL